MDNLYELLVTLTKSKDLDKVSIRCQRLMQIRVTEEYAPRKTLMLADNLSRSRLDNSTETEVEFSWHVNAVMQSVLCPNRNIISETDIFILSVANYQR